MVVIVCVCVGGGEIGCVCVGRGNNDVSHAGQEYCMSDAKRGRKRERERERERERRTCIVYQQPCTNCKNRSVSSKCFTTITVRCAAHSYAL